MGYVFEPAFIGHITDRFIGCLQKSFCSLQSAVYKPFPRGSMIVLFKIPLKC